MSPGSLPHPAHRLLSLRSHCSPIQPCLSSSNTSALGSPFLTLFSSTKTLSDSPFWAAFNLSCQVEEDVSLFCHHQWQKWDQWAKVTEEGLFQLIKGNPAKQELLHKEVACSSTELPAPGKMYKQDLGTTSRGYCEKDSRIKL